MANNSNRTFRFHKTKSTSSSNYMTIEQITGHKCCLSSYEVSTPQAKLNTYNSPLIDGVIDLDTDTEVKYENRVLTMTYYFENGYDLREEIMENLMDKLHGKTFYISKSWFSGKATTWFYHGRVYVDSVRSEGSEGMFCLKCDIEPRMIPLNDYDYASTANEVSVSGSSYITLNKTTMGVEEPGFYRFYIKNATGTVSANLRIAGSLKSGYVTDSYNTAKEVELVGTEKLEINPNGASGSLSWRRYYHPKL